ncbi:MAG: glycogen/starch/alpha-glucan phosphorylase, partial [Thiohalobacterales bacterium]|nr:glycogen/starch/alpha-glucan phosphorylase [Thiohalobacterales bacterium]
HRGDGKDLPPRTIIIGGKAAPGYRMAKNIIKLVNNVANVINTDPAMRGRLQLVFYPDYNVSGMELICPAADLSAQISTAGKEASGTGNMKFSMNGALTIGTLDGANIEIREAVGAENFFLFGHTAGEIQSLEQEQRGPAGFIEENAELQEVIQLIGSGLFSRGDRELFRPLLDSLLHNDPFHVFADFAPYIECQQQVSALYSDTETWARKSILNTARMGWFSSDRSIREYCEDIWKVSPVSVDLQGTDGLGFLQSLQ